ncbi:MAG: GIY-YIG nuclease family protein [Sphingopyxis terrae]|uniref:GIY-YIG nuclease family protein n=1 Tax=Sphingopyxis terrae TaxID=33052 RepID=UPI003F7D5E80
MSVYFIKPIGMDGPIKIGQSKSPATRARDLSRWSPFPLEVVAEIDGGRELEERFHAAFIDHHEHLEWFSAHTDILGAIASINAGTFDVGVLPRASGPIRGLKKRQATWAEIDYDYYGLLLQYYSRDRKAHGWRVDVLQGTAFANLDHDKKLAKIAELRTFLSRPARLAA